jgi:hypothetical protein
MKAEKNEEIMSGSVRLVLTLLAAVFAVYFIWHLATFLLGKLIALVLGVVIPVLIVGALVLGLVWIVNRKALTGGRRTLP